MFKYFNLTKYQSKDDFINRMNNSGKYTLINQMLKLNPLVKKLEFLQDLNEFSNMMLENYSFCVTRNESKNKILSDENIYKNEVEKYQRFIKSWNEIKSEAKKYLCHDEMPIKDLNPRETLTYFLADNGDMYNGMYLASAYENFNEWQNTFLKQIIDTNKTSGILYKYIDNIKKEVPTQEANSNQIILLEQRFKKSKYFNFHEIIYSFSERNIFTEEGKINYSNYNSFTYDYDSIEQELGKIILPGICLFDTNLNFVTYFGEGFRGKSEVIMNINSKYTQSKLNQNEKSIIENNIKSKDINIKEYFSILHLLLYYLSEKSVLIDEENICEAFNKLPKYLKISNKCKNFFTNELKNITINKIIDIFKIFENKCFNNIVKFLRDEYKKEISEGTRTKIINKILNKKNELNKIIKIEDLSNATRMFISRYLIGTSEYIEMQETRDLAYELTREEFWDKNSKILENIENIITELIGEFELKIVHAYSFYNLINKEDNVGTQSKN